MFRRLTAGLLRDFVGSISVPARAEYDESVQGVTASEKHPSQAVSRLFLRPAGGRE